jgi:predicted transcriptional regulator
MPRQNITVRLDPETVKRLDQMAQAMERDRSWLMSHAIERYVEDEAWQVEQIRKAVEKVKSGRANLIPHDEVFTKLEAKIKERLGQA